MISIQRQYMDVHVHVHVHDRPKWGVMKCTKMHNFVYFCILLAKNEQIWGNCEHYEKYIVREKDREMANRQNVKIDLG